MRDVLLRLAIGLLSLSTAVQTAAQEQPKAQSQSAEEPASPWSSEWRAPFCTLTTGSSKELGMSVWSVPGSNSAEIYFVGARDRVPKLSHGTEVSIRLAPSGEAIPAKVVWTAPSWTGVLKLAVIGGDFVSKFGKSGGVTVQGPGKALAVQHEGAAEAARTMQQCMDVVARKWGVDPAWLATLKVRPEGQPGGWLSNEDYPRNALDLSKSGTVVVRLTTDASGKVTNCTVVQSAGLKSIDDVTCRAALKRAKYNPAIGSDGQPTSATFISYATFRVFG